MGFAEIQAAFAAQGAGQPAPAPAVQAAPATAFAPSPFAPQPVAAPALTPIVQAPAPVQQAFTFTPPAGAPTFAPINPPGERAPLAAPAATLAPPDAMMTVTTPAPTVSAPPEAEPPKRRGRKPEPGSSRAKRQAIVEAATQAMAADAGVNLAAEGAAVAQLPADGSTVEDIVQELFARGVSSVHLTFTKDGA